MNVKRTIALCAAMLAAFILVVPANSATPPVEKYPKHWTWKQEKAKHYADGSGRPIWMDPVYYAIAACEQPYGHGSKWTAYSEGYEGGFGFAHSSWDDFKLPRYPNSADKASTWQQYVVAKRIHAHYGNFSGWGCYTGGGYKYHL